MFLNSALYKDESRLSKNRLNLPHSPLSSCVFWVDQKNNMAARLWNGWTEKQDGRPGFWLAETFSTSPLKPLNGNQWNLTGSKISTSSTKFVFFRLIGKTRWPPWPLIGWDIFVFYSETAERNSTKLDRKQDLNVLYQVCVFRADRKNKMVALASDWLRHFWLLLEKEALLNSTKLTGGKISTPSTKFVFFGPVGKTRWPPWPLIGWVILDFSSKGAERNSTKLDRKQDLNILYQVVFFGPMGKTRWLPGRFLKKGCTLYSGTRYVALWASCLGQRSKVKVTMDIHGNNLWTQWRTVVCIFIKLGWHVNHEDELYWYLTSKVKVTIDLYSNNLLSAIETGPLCAFWSNMAYIIYDNVNYVERMNIVDFGVQRSRS